MGPARGSFPDLPGVRQIVVAEIDRVQTSCGMAVPLFDYKGERDNLNQWALAKGEEELTAYRHQKNRQSVDGLVTAVGLDETQPAPSL